MFVFASNLFTLMGKYDESVILQQVAGGSQLAFGQLLDRYAGLVYNQAFRLLKSQEAAEEVVQDVFLQVWQLRKALPSVNNFRSYLFVIGKGFTIDALRKIIRERKAFQDWQQQQLLTLQTEEQSDFSVSVIDQALSQLSPQQQKVWVMSRRLKMTYEAIAAELGISRDAVNKYLQTANKNIVKYLREHPELLVTALVSNIFVV